ncbi:DUF5348 domain-containing protein [Cohnella terricola]|uniref:DUF5348 domain-containing protein n=1 Tax=Cohnella terricola TaxID=1289167 RepID=A0A559JDK9_9BACL|nr:DUF5348 domain-containing protein [Cohnella terricola]TVX97956.1 hypothetical protein FPZ45_17065 [Cohnella terricola]
MKSPKTTKATFILKYDNGIDRWGYPLDNEDWSKDYFHCGDVFLLKIGEQMLKCHIEMDNDWYIISGNQRFRLHPREHYEIIIL